jgi:hypothetical protein
MKSRGVLALLVLAFPLACSKVAAQGTGSSDDWEFQLTPYAWLPTIAGKLNYELPEGGGNMGGGVPRIDVGPTDWLELVNGVFLLNAEVRKSRFLAFTDIVYLGLESDEDRVLSVSSDRRDPVLVDGSLDLKTQTDIDGFTMTLAGGYNLFAGERSSVDVFAGARYFGMEASTRWALTADVALPGGDTLLEREGSIDSEQDYWDGIVGIKGSHAFGGGNWSLPYYLDVGTGDSDLTWQAVAGLSYAFKWGDLILSYRHFEYDGGPEELMQDFSFSGPVIGGRFTF